MEEKRFQQKTEVDIHLILQHIKDLKNNDLAHIEKRLTKLEVASKFHTGLLMITIAAILGFGIAGLAL
tara:strand:+ start:123 stop:326 length:204 start_codon:yes stop_codon:yes gene_type:complete